jgi:polysaccharide export outer membrane protein
MVLIASASVSAQTQAGMTPGFVLAPGDVIRIEVWRNKELSGDFPIAADGSITHPLYRELKVAGVPLPAVEQQVRTFLSRYESNPSFVLFPLMRVIVAGEVRQPNIYTVPPGTTVAQAIAMAGGPSDRGRLDRIQLLRRSGSTMLDVTRPEAGAASVEVNSGDQIIIGRRRSIMQDVIAPSAGILAALAAVTGVIIQLSRHP